MATNLDITIRPARPSDCKELAAFDQRLAKEPELFLPLTPDEVHTVDEYEDRLRKIGTPPNTLYLIAERQGKIVGSLSSYSMRLRAFTHAVHLGVSVDGSCRGQGIGTRLIQTAIEWARAQKLKRIELRVYADNEQAIRLYQRLGFVIEGVLKQAILHRGRYMDEVVMALLLDPSNP